MSGCCRLILTSVLLLLVVAVLSPAGHAATPEQVDTALRKGVAYLYKAQNKDGNWEQAQQRDPKGGTPSLTAGQWGGQTAIATYALLAAGENPQHPQLKRAIEFLKQADIIGVYALGMRAQVWALIPMDASVRAAAIRDANLIAAATKTEGNARGFYDYIAGAKGGRYDHSVSQYGVLGMWALSQAGIEIPLSYWQGVDEAWKRDQGPTGGWLYGPGKPDATSATPSMTAAGVASLFITQDYLSMAMGAQTKGNMVNPAIDAGLKWLSNPFIKPTGMWLYTMYGIERIGVASGYKYFGANNWYELGSEWVTKAQRPDGSWHDWGGQISGTSFAILFLTRGRAPVVMNKLEYSIVDRGKEPVEGNWNQRPRDVANVVRWIGRQLERDLNWQIVNLKVPVDELHDSQILYISGDQNLLLSDEGKAKLKQFVQQGGIILGSAEGRGRAFARSFQTLGEELFGYKFRVLPEEHPIYNEQFPRRNWRNKPVVQGMSNGARELMILIPDADPGRWWQTNLIGSHEEVWQLMANLFLYSVDRQNLRFKGQTYIVSLDEKVKAPKKQTIYRVKYNGNWDPEPGGWVRLNAVMHNAKLMDLDVKPVEIGKDALGDGKVVHLTGTDKVTFTSAQRDVIKKFVESGGTLVIDATGGQPAFAQSIELELDAIFGTELTKQLKSPLPESDAIYSAGGTKLDDIRYRGYARRTLLGNLRAGRLRGIKIDGRTAVIYSQEDLSVGLVGQPVDGVIGYEPDTATALMRNILMYATHTPAATQPSTRPAAGAKPAGGK